MKAANFNFCAIKLSTMLWFCCFMVIVRGISVRIINFELFKPEREKLCQSIELLC